MFRLDEKLARICGGLYRRADSSEAVAAYHDALRKQGVTTHRDLAADNQITEAVLQLG